MQPIVSITCGDEFYVATTLSAWQARCLVTRFEETLVRTTRSDRIVRHAICVDTSRTVCEQRSTFDRCLVAWTAARVDG